MSSSERFNVECPKCGRENWFSKRELCGQKIIFERDTDSPKDEQRRVKLNRACDHCGYDLTKKVVQIDCEGYE